LFFISKVQIRKKTDEPVFLIGKVQIRKKTDEPVAEVVAVVASEALRSGRRET
jgi:hypothetical protein